MLLAIAAACAAVLLALAAGFWLAATSWLRADRPLREIEFPVLGVEPDLVTLPRAKETLRRGAVALFGPDWSRTELGEVEAADRGRVRRRLAGGDKAPPVGTRVVWSKFFHRGDPQSALGLAFREVAVPGPLGPLPAWLLPGHRRTWILAVHGYRASREEALRALPTMVQSGHPVLVTTYRNDIGAPRSPDGLYHLGDSEWADLEAAAHHALAQGAEDVILFGWSMGGCIVETFLRRSTLSSRVRGVILDSPVLDWHRVVRMETRQRRLPPWLAPAIARAVALRAGIDLAALDHVRAADPGRPPTLLFHGADDRQVPVAGSDDFAAATGGRVRYHRVEGADHTYAWNVDREGYERALAEFLSAVGDAAPGRD